MRKSGLREARHHLASLIDDVKKGREVVITERGRAVARLVPAGPPAGKGLPELKSLRVTLRPAALPLSAVVADDRDDRF